MSEDRKALITLRDASLTLSQREGALRSTQSTILEGINLELLQGETLGLVGRNGSGKSTLLRLMAGIFQPTTGEVVVEPGISRSVLAIGLGFRGDLSGRDNAYLSTILKGAPPAEARSYLEEIKAFSELGDAFEKPVKTYSSGMRSRLGFSTALISHVDVLFVDEVLSVGDGHFRKKATQAIKEKIMGKQTVVFVSHGLPHVRELCDRVVWLEDGHVREMGGTGRTLAAYRASL